MKQLLVLLLLFLKKFLQYSSRIVVTNFFFHFSNTTKISNLLPTHDPQQPRIKIFAFIVDISVIYPISMDIDTKFRKTYPSTNIFKYFTYILSIFQFFSCFNRYFWIFYQYLTDFLIFIIK